MVELGDTELYKTMLLVSYFVYKLYMYTLIVIILTIILCIVNYCVYNKIRYYNAKPIQHNFPFIWKGVKYWYSRSCAVVGFVFCKDRNNNLFVLANKRGKGTPDYQGYWNAPCGYLDFDEKLEDACCREILEETGINIPSSSLDLRSVSSDPSDNRQNVTCRYSVILNGTIDDYSFNTDKMEECEVADVKWVKVDGELDDYKWAFGHKELINDLSKKYI